MKNIQSIIKEIAVQVNNNGGKMYYVGGYVRDLLLGKKPSDIDIRVIGISKEVFNSILEQFGKTCWIDARYDLVKLIGLDIDFSSPENKDGKIKTIDDLTEGTDFTMNSILVDVISGEMIDLFNGKRDIKNKIIRISRINNIDDEFLAVRACRFKAKLGFDIDEESKNKIRRFTFAEVKKQRILPELRKIITDSSINHSDFYKTALDLKVLEKIFEPLDKLNGLEVMVNEEKIDAFEHTMRMLNYFMRFKDEISDFEEFYMICLTYHLRSIKKQSIVDDFREFFGNILVTNKMRNIVFYFQDNERILFETYNNFQNMSIEDLASIYAKFRKRLEYAGYVIESFNMGMIENLTEEQLAESKKRTDLWKEKIALARQVDIKTLAKPKVSKKKKLKKAPEKSSERKVAGGFTLEEIDLLTKDITPAQVKSHFGEATCNRRKHRNGRNR